MCTIIPYHHVEFDYGLMAIDPITLIILSKEESDQYHGKKFRSKHSLNVNNLEYHLKYIFRTS